MPAVFLLRRLRLYLLVLIPIAAFSFLTRSSVVNAAPSAITTQNLTVVTPTDLVNSLVGSGISVSNISFTGDQTAGGIFSGGAGIVGFENGIVLSSGDIADIVGPNQSDSQSTDHQLPGDADLGALSGFGTRDAAALTFDFVPDSDTVFFRFVFASEEYNEFVNTQFNDVFAFFVNGQNCATVADGAPVSINTINNGNPLGVNPTNPDFYINNDVSDGGGTVDIEADGLTVVLNCVAPVTPNAVNSMKLAIADASDGLLDSMVLLESQSLTTTPSVALAPQSATLCTGAQHTLTAIVTDVDTVGIDVAFSVVDGPNAGLSAMVTTDETSQATWTYGSDLPGTDMVEASFVGSNGGTATSLPVTVTWETCVPPSITLVPVLQFVCLDDVAGFMAQIENDAVLSGVEVTLEVISGPNAGLIQTGITTAAGAAQFEYPGIAGGVDGVVARFVDSDGILRESAAVDVIWEVCAAPQITLTPASQSVCSDQAAVITAAIVNPLLDGVPVTFEVVVGPNAGFSTTVATDSTGQAVLNYFGFDPGTDTVQASFIDDFGGVVLSNQVSVTWEACVIPEVFLEPFAQEACLQAEASVTAFAVDVEPAGIDITFNVVSGPNIGTSGVVTTDPGGAAAFSYAGTVEGVDTVEVRFTASDGTVQISNPVTIAWQECTPTCSATTMFGVYDQNIRDSQFFTVSLDTGLSAPLGPLYDNYDIEALERDPATGTLYAIAGGDSVVAGDFFEVDPAVGALTRIGNTGADGVTEIVAAAMRADGMLWAFQQGVGLLTVDRNSGDTSFVWDPATAGLGDNWEGLAWNRYGTALYGAQDSRLYRYDPATMSAEQVCGDSFLPNPTEGLGTRDDGALLGGWHNATDDTLRVFVIDPNSCTISSSEYDIIYNDVESLTFDLCEPEGAVTGLFMTDDGRLLPRGTEVRLVGAGPDGALTSTLPGARDAGDDVFVSTGMIGADGRFAFEGLPMDTYTVVIDESTLPPGTAVSNYPFEVSIGPGERYDHGLTPTALTGGRPGIIRSPAALWVTVGLLAMLAISGAVWRRRT